MKNPCLFVYFHYTCIPPPPPSTQTYPISRKIKPRKLQAIPSTLQLSFHKPLCYSFSRVFNQSRSSIMSAIISRIRSVWRWNLIFMINVYFICIRVRTFLYNACDVQFLAHNFVQKSSFVKNILRWKNCHYFFFFC